MKLDSTIERAVLEAFSGAAAAAISTSLESASLPLLDAPDRAEERGRVQLAILRLARGSRERFDEALRLAERDWRDLLVVASLENADWKEVVARTPWEHVACAACEEVNLRYAIRTRGELDKTLRVIEGNLADRTLEPTPRSGGEPFELRPGGAIPDVIDQTYACKTCGRRFRLFVESFHGSGGEWSPLPPGPG